MPDTETLLSRLAAEPALIAEGYETFVRSACRWIVGNAPETLSLGDECAASDDFWDPNDWRAEFRPYVVVNGILMIPVKGVLLADFPYAVGSWATGYDYIWRAFERGVNDYAVRGIALVCDSPGGEVRSCFDTVDRMYALRDRKPVRTFAMEKALSAAYAVGSVGRQLVVSRTGAVGSIGVVTMHVDYSEALKSSGIRLTFIYAGKHKVDGNPYQSLGKDVRDRIQERIDYIYDIFVAAVARNKNLSEQQIRDTEALVYSANEALTVGLADRIGSLDEAVAAFAAEIEDDEPENETMSTDKQATPAIDEQAVETARAEGVQAGRAEGAKAERERIFAIMALPEAENRRESALKIATTTDMSVDQVKALLATLPETEKAAAEPDETPPANGKSPFEAAMEKTEVDVEAGAAVDTDVSAVSRILADYAKETGYGPQQVTQ